ncbi:FKBP-type peptidyl-prolyl cis-trans isomerase [Vampirovibrio sp.]|uniref:FKBP-type peptidyl-prolyl cis-trans isomerase n=1 Tax=Vampirovibrio sp. TaxID=2717857 RepID=UPI003593E39D
MQNKPFNSLLCVALCAGSLLALTGCDEKAATTTTQTTTTTTTTTGETSAVTASTKSISGIQVQDVTLGSGAEAQKGDTVSVNYLGTLASSGKKFDSSYDRNEPFTFKLGSGQVIEGWDKGLVGMKEGGKRILTIPPEKAYGASGYPPVIPANATLKFEVELVEVK